MPAELVLDQLDTASNGLTDDEVTRRQEEYGRNVFPEQEPPTLWQIILRQFQSPLIYILLLAGIVSLAIGEFTDAIFIFIVLLINAGLGAYQEYRAEQRAAALQQMLKVTARVRRAGGIHEIDAEELVPGDVVVLESGDRVPADIRLTNTGNLAIDESLLTGESVAVNKTSEVFEAEDLPVSDRANIAYMGATVMSGRGTGVVVATGLETEIGKIAEATLNREASKPPLVIRMERFVRVISFVVLGASALLVIISMLQGVPFTEIFFLAVALAVSAIPEGLPVAMTVALAIAVSRMAQRKVIVRQMPAVEGLGSCTLVASDKTGTLTVNKQTVRQVVLPDGKRFDVSGEGYSGEGEATAVDSDALRDDDYEHLRALAKASVLCNEGDLKRVDGEWKFSGDAVDVALLAFGYKLDFDVPALRDDTEMLYNIPFESERQYAAMVYRDADGVEIAVKGAVEKLLEFCEKAWTDAGEVAIDRQVIADAADALAEEGYRVLAIAQGLIDDRAARNGFEEEDIPALTLLGLVGMIDPLRPEARDAVQTARRAGVEVAMITGDHPATALAIARELNIADSRDDLVIGRDLPEVESGEEPAFAEKVRAARVFARVSPIQKLHIVEALRNEGEFIAVTGDGVNDTPALRAANIGVAMGSGTDVAKDAAAIIVIDDNFASIMSGIEEGRYAYDNLRKVIFLLVSTGAAEIALFLVALIIGLPLPLLAVQILWLNLVTNGIQGVALAFEEGESGAMTRPPRPPKEGIFDSLMIQQVLLSATVMFAGSIGLWYWLITSGWEEATARNLVLLLMVLFQNFHVFNCRSERVSAFRVPLQRNWVLVVGVIAALGLHLLVMWLPFMQPVLEVQPVTLEQFGYMGLLAATILFVMEGFKLIKFKSYRRQDANGDQARA